MDVPEKIYWHGKALEEFTKEELIEIVKRIHEMYLDALKNARENNELAVLIARRLR